MIKAPDRCEVSLFFASNSLLSQQFIPAIHRICGFHSNKPFRASDLVEFHRPLLRVVLYEAPPIEAKANKKGPTSVEPSRCSQIEQSLETSGRHASFTGNSFPRLK